LTAKDLCILGQCSRFFRDTSSAAKVWNNLLNRDFFFFHDIPSSSSSNHVSSGTGTGYAPIVGSNRLSSFLSSMQPTSNSINNSNSNNNSITGPATTTDATKQQYIRQYQQMKTRYNQKKMHNQAFQKSIETDRRRTETEQALEITQLRIMIPLPFAAAFISLLLVGLKYSGYDMISSWFCAIPMLFYLVYLLVCGVVTWYVRRNEFEQSSVCYGLWPAFQGPVEICFPRSNDRASTLVTTLFVVITFLCILEILLITLKMSLSPQPGGPETYPTAVNLSWAAAFAPLWVIFGLYCLLPLSDVLRAGSNYDKWLTGLLIVWVPFFIFAVCLVMKLGYEEAGNDDKANNIRLALVLMPFWIFEGVILLTSLCFLCDGCIK